MGPSNTELGDAMGIDLPAFTPDETGVSEEKNMARYAKSKEFKRVRQHCEDRIKFYQTYMPDGRELGLECIPTSSDWVVANRVIGELKLLMNMYDTAVEVVKDSVKNG